MKLNNRFVSQMFKGHHKKTGDTGTHVFVYSEKQNSVIQSIEGKRDTYVKGLKYTEMRSRDAGMEFNWDDTVFVAVGSHSDITFLP